MKGSIGYGGWVGIDGLDLPGPLYLRFRDDAGRLRISELYLDASRGSSVIETQDVRGLPIHWLEAFINYYEEHVRRQIAFPAPDLSTLASYFRTTFVNFNEPLAEGNWVVGCLASQLIPPGEERATTEHGLPVMRVPHARRQWKGVREADVSFRLTSGPTEGLTDEFLHDVARAYAAAVARGEPPNVAIHEQTGYPVKTAQRWVYTARLRGIMPRGRKGAAG
jgi:hypothetical protein